MYTQILMFCLALLFALPARALPPEVEADRLAIKAKTALDAKDYAQAAASLAEMEKLGVPLPQSFHYLKAVAQNGTGKHHAAKESLEKYLQITGTSGKFYKEALEAYNLAEQEGKRVISAYQANQVRYEKALDERKKSIQECYQRDKSRYARWRQEYESVSRRRDNCSNSCFLNCDRCRPLWDEAGRVAENQPDEPSEYDCSQRISEPRPPVPPVLY